MARHTQAFASADGGYQGSNALVDNTSEFYLDLGKTAGYATLDLSDTSATMNLLDYGNVLGIEVIIEDSFGNLNNGAEANTFDTKLFHTTDNEYTDEITTSIESETPTDRVVGGEANTWGKSWSANDINGIKVRLCNPIEPNGGASIALRATFVYARITYNIPGPHIPTLTITTGRLNIQQGNITIS
tara:strand:+ start:3307 stop:3867 length:561 start_codon:yes stop_codon:yes gene_type:complete